MRGVVDGTSTLRLLLAGGRLAALALGAVGVWMGTRFIATAEARGHENYKRRITEIDEDGTIVTRAHSGKPNRMIRNDFTRSWEGREAEIVAAQCLHGRLLPEDIAAMVMFLAWNDARLITGHDYFVDGGWC